MSDSYNLLLTDAFLQRLANACLNLHDAFTRDEIMQLRKDVDTLLLEPEAYILGFGSTRVYLAMVQAFITLYNTFDTISEVL